MKSYIFPNLRALYGPGAAGRLVSIYRQSTGPFRYLGKFWTTQNFAEFTKDTSRRYRPVRWLLATGMLLQIVCGLALIYADYAYGATGGYYLGVATIISYPIVWAHVLFGLILGWALMHPKRYGKALICNVLEHQVRLLRERNDFTLIAVAGSVGKTSTKLAVAQLIATTKRVRYEQGNYNDRLTVPLVLFNVREPNIYNLAAWAKIYIHNRRKLKQPYPYDVAVVELGTDGPGQMKDFAYLHPDLTIVTAVAEEHMEYFKTLDAVAHEELQVFDYSTQVLVNADDVAGHYLTRKSFESYGTDGPVDYHVKLAGSPSKAGQKITLRLKELTLTVQSQYYGVQGSKIVLAAAAVGHMLELSQGELKGGLAGLMPFSGRMQVLKGIQDATLLDDSYNASPIAVRAALDVLYSLDSSQRIAILGSMNELGETSATAHAGVGAYCDPDKVSLVVTIGEEAKKHLAPAAQQRGCTVKSFADPLKAGEYVRSQLKKHAAVLAKGSQNRVFAEEALKPLLANQDDAAKLVRQSDYWMNIKHGQFGE